MSDVDSRSFTVLSLCAGAGGLDLGLRLAVFRARTVGYVEIEAYACELLATRMGEDVLDAAPVWTNLRTFDGKPWRGIVDCVIGGYPCQPFSVAGKQRGADDPRHLWPEVARIVGEIEPEYCFFENVSNHLRLGFREVATELHSMGYGVAAGLFTAEEARAPHKRERLFIMAHTDDGFGMLRESPRSTGLVDRRDEKLADADCAIDISGRGLQPTGTGATGSRSEAVAHTGCIDDARGACLSREPQARRAFGEPARSGVFMADAGSAFPPAPSDLNEWREVLARWPEVEPALCGMVDGMAARVDRLRLTGNGVVPVVAAHAFRTLHRDLIGTDGPDY